MSRTGSPATVTIADTDTGADYDHPDLYQNIWINQPEIPTSRMKNLVDVYHDGYISWRDLNNPINIGPGKITDVNGDGRHRCRRHPLPDDPECDRARTPAWAAGPTPATLRTATPRTPTT